jgi:hypothetical protein
MLGQEIQELSTYTTAGRLNGNHRLLNFQGIDNNMKWHSVMSRYNQAHKMKKQSNLQQC